MTRNEKLQHLHKLEWRYKKSGSAFSKATIYMLIQAYKNDADSLVSKRANQLLGELK